MYVFSWKAFYAISKFYVLRIPFTPWSLPWMMMVNLASQEYEDDWNERS